MGLEEFRGEVVEWDKENDTFRFQTPKETITVKFRNHSYDDVVWYGFEQYHKENWVLNIRKPILIMVEKEGEEYIFSSAKKLSMLDPLFRLEQLAELEDDCDCEELIVPTEEEMKWMRDFFDLVYPPKLRYPYISLTDGFWFEWSNVGYYPYYVCLEVDYKTHKGEGYIRYDKEKTENIKVDLNNINEVMELFYKLGSIEGFIEEEQESTH